MNLKQKACGREVGVEAGGRVSGGHGDREGGGGTH